MVRFFFVSLVLKISLQLQKQKTRGSKFFLKWEIETSDLPTCWIKRCIARFSWSEARLCFKWSSCIEKKACLEVLSVDGSSGLEAPCEVFALSPSWGSTVLGLKRILSLSASWVPKARELVLGLKSSLFRDGSVGFFGLNVSLGDSSRCFLRCSELLPCKASHPQVNSASWNWCFGCWVAGECFWENTLIFSRQQNVRRRTKSSGSSCFLQSCCFFPQVVFCPFSAQTALESLRLPILPL